MSADMNFRQIEIFKAIMETGSVTAASDRLNMSQPAASKHLRLLEQSIGLPLFERTGNRLIPSLEAKALHDQVERSYRGLDHLARFVGSLKQHPAGEISIAAMPMLARRWLPEILSPFLLEHTSVSLSFPIRSSSWITDAVAAGQVDIGLGLAVFEKTDVSQESIMDVPLVCIMKTDHPLARQSIVSAQDLSPHTLITLSNFDQWRLAVETVLDDGGARPVRRVDTFTTQVACELAKRGVGVAVIDALTAFDYADHGLEWRLFKPALAFEIVLMRSGFRTQSILAHKLIDKLRTGAAETEMLLSSLVRGQQSRFEL
ncbi:MAG: LysR substrate-binding domain-containing protein [Alphaproteobacteria bacterium]|nr:LysR substrate-binding domain-containing protein [Alphaproteobacteria bacterium]